MCSAILSPPSSYSVQNYQALDDRLICLCWQYSHSLQWGSDSHKEGKTSWCLSGQKGSSPPNPYPQVTILPPHSAPSRAGRRVPTFTAAPTLASVSRPPNSFALPAVEVAVIAERWLTLQFHLLVGELKLLLSLPVS